MGERKEKGRLFPVAGQEKHWQQWEVPEKHHPLWSFFSGTSGGNYEDDKDDDFFIFGHVSPLAQYTQDNVKIPTGSF